MSVYSLSQLAQVNAFAISSGTVQAGLMSVRRCSVVAATSSSLVDVRHTASSVSGALTPEKTNTRSPAPLAAYWQQVIGSLHSIITLDASDFNFIGWIAHPRYVPITTDLTDVIDVEGGGSGNTQFTVEENIRSHRWSRRSKRRSRRGYTFTYGNTVARIATSGGGAFSAIFPQFQTDVTWVDESAWRLGHTTSEIWNLNLFGGQRRRATMF